MHLLRQNQERVVDNMDKKEMLMKIKQIVESGNYDVEELLTVIPNDLLEDVMSMIKNQAKQESEEIKLDLTNRQK